MTKIKKYFRQILCIAGFLLMAIVFAFNPAVSFSVNAVQLTEQTLTNAVSTVRLPNTVVDVSKGQDLVVPLLSNKTDYTIRVTDANGKNHDCVVTSSNATADKYFETATISISGDTVNAVKVASNKLIDGNYSITYIYDNVYTYPFAVEVKGVNYELSFVEEDGSKILLPSTAGDAQPITLPTAYVKFAGQDEYLLDDEVKVTANLTIEKDNAVIYSTKKGASNTTTEVKDIDGKLQLTTNLPTGENGEKEHSVTYRLTYKYEGGNNMPAKVFYIVVTDDYKAPTSLKINKTDLPAMELGQKDITLPEWTASAGTVSNVEVNITKIVIEKEGNSNIKLELKNNNRTFDFTKDKFGAESYKDMVGNYKITYFMESAYPGPADNTKKLSTSDYKIVYSVTDSSKPDVYMAYSYEVEEGNVVGDVNKDYEVEFKSNFGYGEIVFPAIYAEDLVNSYDELVVYRYFQRKNDISKKYYIDNVKLDDNNVLVPVAETEEGYNASGDQNIGKTNKIVRFKFNTSLNRQIEEFTNKDYTLHYYVVNKEGATRIVKQENNLYETGREPYTFKVLNKLVVGQVGDDDVASEGTSKPTIKINDLANNSSVNKNEKLTVTVDASDELDKHLKNAVFFYTGDEQSDVKTKFKTALNDLVLSQTWGKINEETKKPDADDAITYFDNFKCNILYNDQLLTKLNGLTGITRFNEVDNSTFETDLDLVSGTKLNLVAVTLNDNNTIEVATKTLKVNDTDDYLAPKATETQSTETNHVETNNSSKFNQGINVYLPTITFEDTDSSLKAYVKYYVLTESEEPEVYLTPKDTVYSQQKDKLSIEKGRIVTSKVGTYYVVYTAIDDAGNQTVVSYYFVVENSSLPTLSVNPAGDNIEKSGRSIKAETYTAITFHPTITDYSGKDLSNDTEKITKSITAVGKKYGYTAIPSGNEDQLLFENADEYEVTVTVTYDSKPLEKQVFYVTITEPELTWAEFDEDAIPSKADIGETIYLPNIKAVFGKNNLPIPVTISVKDPDNKTPEWGDVLQDEETGYWYFKTNGGEDADATRSQKGTYKVTYTANWNGSTITKVFDIKVGDSIGPEFRFGDVTKLEQDLVYDGTNGFEYTIELNRYATTSNPERTLVIKVLNKGKLVYEVNTGLKIYDKDGTITNGVTTSTLFTNWSNLQVELKTTDGKLEEVQKGENDTFEKRYNINGIGKYTLVLTMTDNYNNPTTKEFNFDVVAKSTPKENNDNVVGIVLIVVSLVILAGVILFFTFTGKKGGSNKTKSTKTKKQQAETSVETDSDAKSGDVE